MSPQDIHQMASALIAERIANKETVQLHWAAQEIINNFPRMSGEDADFYLLCARDTTTRIVKSVIALYDKPDENAEEQLILEGYDFLREAYSVERDQQPTVVPIYLLTDEELEDRARQFDKQADSMRRHAAEIRSYIAKRRRQLQDTASIAQ